MSTTTPESGDEDPQHRLPPDTARALREYVQRNLSPSFASLQRSLAPSVENLQRQLAPSLAGLRRQLQQISVPRLQLEVPALEQALADMRRQILPVLQSPQLTESLRKIGEAVTRYYPRNWVGVDVDPDAALKLARTEGLPLVWVPRGEFVVDLLSASDIQARRKLLEKHASDIVADCTTAAAEVSHPALQEHRKRLLEATQAHAAGLHGPGQSMSAVVVTALLQWVYDHGQLKKVKSSPLRAPTGADDLAFRLFKVAVLIEASVAAVQGGRDQLPMRTSSSSTGTTRCIELRTRRTRCRTG